MVEKEKKIKDSIRPITLPMQKVITRQMEKCVCKIHIVGGNGTGFFALIPYKNTLLKVLITNNHILNADAIKDDKIITFSINNNIKDIKIKKERKRYTSEKFDTTIIEIIEEMDSLEGIVEYLEVDDINIKCIKEYQKAFSDEHFNNLYKDDSLYVLNYLGGKEIVASYGIFVTIKDSEIYHKCSTDNGSSGSPILSLENNKLIGVHYGYSKMNPNSNYNLGTLIAYPIKEFQNIISEKEIKKKPLNSMTIRYEFDELAIIDNIMSLKYNLERHGMDPKINMNFKKLRLFGEEFVKNNKNNCVIIINGKIQELCEYIDIDENLRKRKYLEIQLKEVKTITNMSHMFCRGVEEIDGMFVTSIPDISKWDTSNVFDMSYLFCCCENLKFLPDISSWNTTNVKKMSNMISYCGKLESLPDISKWDTRNVIDMSHMFANNWNIKSFPDISKWNTSKVETIDHMFTRCGIDKMPDISKWDTSNVKDMSYMFSYCKNMDILPYITKWHITNANMRGMFFYCNYIDIPQIYNLSRWKNISENLNYIFYYCDGEEITNFLRIISNKFHIGIKYLYIWHLYGSTYNLQEI